MSSHFQEPPHWRYTHHPRHTSASSEPYTGADSLLSALRSGWQVEGDVSRSEIWRGVGRLTVVYRFTLRLGDDRRTLAVIDNPYVTRFIVSNNLRVVPYLRPDTVSV